MDRTRSSRHGFTLIELLIAIAIIGMLAGITTVAVRSALYKAKQTKIQIEIDQLTQALNGYKEKAREFPPCFGEAVSEGDYVLMKRFVDHLKYAFPKFNPSGADIQTQYAQIRSEVLSNYFVRDPQDPSSTMALDLNTLVLNHDRSGNVTATSQAEALVFWLSGLPMPINSTSGLSIGSSKTFGFHQNAFNPFQLQDAFPSNATVPRQNEIMLSKRTARLFSFNESRLVDLDKDGWLEYAPDGEDSTGQDVHPYVYFDAKTYARPGAGAYDGSNNSPRNEPPFRPYCHLTSGGSPDDYCVPYAMAIAKNQSTIEFQSGSTVLWMNERSFQIISAGLDSRYTLTGQQKWFALLPNQQSPNRFLGGGYSTDFSDIDGSFKSSFSKDEDDNQVSFSGALVKDIFLK